MKYFKLAYDIFINKFLFNLLIIIEIAAMLILTNAVIATYNSKKILYEPYEEILSENGVVFICDGLEEGYYNNEEIEKIIDKYSYIYYPALLELFKEKLEGDIKITYTINRFLRNDEGGPVSQLAGYNTDNINFFYIDHDIFDKLRMPLAAGRWPSSEKNENNETEIIISGGTDAVLNKVYDTPLGKIKVVGILTDNTYLPPSQFPDNSLNDKLSIFDYYKSFDSNVSLMSPFALVDQQLAENIDETTQFGIVWFISYGEGLSEEAINKNTEYLRQFGEIRNLYGEETFKTLSEQSNKYLNDIYTRMLPIVIAAAVVVLAGLIGSIAISTVKQIKNFSIFFLCGSCWKDCTRIIIAYLTIMFSLAAVLTILCIGIMKIINMDYLIGSVYGINNIAVSIAEIIVMYLLAIILPHNIIKTSFPIETIRET